LRKLSLSAEKNWVQNSGANRRDVMSSLTTVVFLFEMKTHFCDGC
jgi:hypothetical protein